MFAVAVAAAVAVEDAVAVAIAVVAETEKTLSASWRKVILKHCCYSC